MKKKYKKQKEHTRGYRNHSTLVNEGNIEQVEVPSLPEVETEPYKFKRIRTSKKMEEKWDDVLRQIRLFHVSEVKLIPDYARELIEDFERIKGEMQERGADIGHINEWRIDNIKQELKRVEEDGKDN